MIDDDNDVGTGRSVPRDREISLGTGMLLAMFFALALICAVFFGFGYSLGAHHAPPVAAAVPPVDAPTGTNFSSFKPSPGSPAASAKPSKIDAIPAGPAVAVKTPPAGSVNVADESEAAPAAPAPKAAKPAPVAAAAPAPIVPGAPTFVVQVAAVSHQEDADLLVSTLKRRSYNVAIHQESQDKLLHVQIGPFANRKEADVMRQRLLADGFNAIVK
jgi:cell division septation protein DedD